MYQPITPLFPLFHLQINFLFYFKERKVEIATPRPLEDVQRRVKLYCVFVRRNQRRGEGFSFFPRLF